MAGKKISQLVEKTELTGNEFIPVQDGNDNKKVKTSALKGNDNYPIVDHATGDTTFALTPNVFHKWGEVASLNLTLATPTDNTIVNEYMFQFDSGATATTLSLPSSIEWIGDKKVEASKTYQVSILNNIAVMGGV